jgi:integrase/predicted RNA-binding Zn-ribbon protein involved in translation (DUF1610 family)
MAGLTQASDGSIFGVKAGSNSGKSPPEGDAGSSPLCPQCGSKKVWRAGLRYHKFGDQIQRWLCRDCGLRFSDPEDVARAKIAFEKAVKMESKSLKSDADIVFTRQICVKETKNLVALEELSTSAGTPQPKKKKKFGAKSDVSDEVRALVAVYRSWLDKEGYCKGGHYPNNLIRLAGLGADLSDPESVKVIIGNLNVRNGTKLQYVYAYDAFARMMKISWEPPHYKQEEIIPFVPDESELNQLIAACHSKRMVAYLQCLKETFADPGEVLRIRRKDVSGNIITINFPVKGHLPRQLQVSHKLIAMLNTLPEKSESFFPTSYHVMWSCYEKVRKRAAEIQKNPRLLQIELRTFRHWGGTMLAHYTNGNVLMVKKLLGHKRIENTMKYIGMIHFEDDEFEVTTATTVEEAKEALSVGYDYITEKSGIMLFRRPRRFRHLEDKRRSSIINLK